MSGDDEFYDDDADIDDENDADNDDDGDDDDEEYNHEDGSDKEANEGDAGFILFYVGNSTKTSTASVKNKTM